MKTILKYKRIFLLLLVPISFLLILLAKHSTFFAEYIFALRIYKWISQIVSLIIGILPFSLAEILFISLPIVILVAMVRFIIGMVKDKGNRGIRVLKGILNVLCVFSVLLFTFVITGGINYYRYTFSHYSNLEIRDSSVLELLELTESLAIQANEIRSNVPQTDEEGVFQLSVSTSELGKLANQAFDELSKDYPVLGGSYGAPKPILLSPLMSHTETTGIFIPFTMEANVNVAVPHYTIPATMLHEMAHLRGFMREDEANFIAYMASMKSDNIEIQYSGIMMALVYAGNALYDQDPTLYFQVRNQYSEEVRKDVRASAAYWSQFRDTVISTVSNKMNDTYLKANNQADGVQSYGRMVDLLIANYYKMNKGNE